MPRKPARPVKAEKPKRRVGRPTMLTDDLAEDLFDHLAHGKSLAEWCRKEENPNYKTVLIWLRRNKEFALNYARAREEQAEFFVDTMPTIADTDSDPARAKLRIETRKWIAGRMKPKKYGDKFIQEHTGPDGAPLNGGDDISLTDLARRVLALVQLGAKQQG